MSRSGDAAHGLAFLVSRRWIGFAVFVIALAGLCVLLGSWQFEKLADRNARNTLVEKHLGIDPVPLDTAVPVGTDLSASQEWTVVTATGTYDLARQVTVKYVSRNGRPGVDILTPLRLPDGSAVLVNRGFVETPRSSAPPTDLPVPPTGPVEVMGWLRLDSGATGEAIRVNDSQVRAISSVGLSSHVQYDLRSGFINLQEQSPDTAGLEAEPRPELGPGTHLSYGLQWWFFGALALTGFIWFARAELHERRTHHSSP